MSYIIATNGALVKLPEIDGEPLCRTDHESDPAFCLATWPCMNVGPSFLQASTPSCSSISPTRIRLVVSVQPGCTNLGLGALLCSRTNADHESRIGSRLARAKTEYKWRIGSVAHAFILGEHTANVNSQDYLVVMLKLHHYRLFLCLAGQEPIH
jgi:hypothetical protein